MNNREIIDIEGLLVRAYREKQIHTLNAGGAIALALTRARSPGATFSASDKVDTSSFAAQMAAELRELQAFASSAKYEVMGPAALAEPWKGTARVLSGVPVSDLVDDEPAPDAVVLKPKRKRPYVPRKTKENRTIATAQRRETVV